MPDPTTPARGASPRPWTQHPMIDDYIVPASEATLGIGASMHEADDLIRYARIIASVGASKRAFAHGVSKEEARANRALIVLAVNAYAGHVALLRRALESLENYGPEGFSDQYFSEIKADLRAALADAEVGT